jgi:hypothetical protein
MEKAKALPVISDWLKTNDSQLTEIRDKNPELYGAMFSALNYLNKYLGAKKTLEPEIIVEAPIVEAPILTTPTTILELDWKILPQKAVLVSDLLDTYTKYINNTGNLPIDDSLQNLIKFFGDVYIITPSNKDYKYANEVFKMQTKNVPFWRYVIKPRYRPYFKNFKRRLENFKKTENEGFCLIDPNEVDFSKYLNSYLKEDLLFNILSIPDILKNKIIPTEEQAEFEDLADELNNLEI